MHLTREAMYTYLVSRGLMALAPEYGPAGEKGRRP
mgnify:CR=1 FL=1